MTGKAYGQCFSDANIFINYQVTKAKGQLLQRARAARYAKSIHKYSTDQNGNISVQCKFRGSWTRISSPADLDKCISDGRQEQAAAAAWQGPRQHTS